MPENVTLVKLNAILQYAMGWLGGHLHEYVIGRLHYGVPDENWPSLDPVIDERRVRLNSSLSTVRGALPTSMTSVTTGNIP